MKNEVTDLLEALYNGSMTINEVAQKFRQRSWPRREQPLPSSYEEIASLDVQDPSHYVPGSYDDVAAAYHKGQLTDAQYTILVNAITESKSAEDKHFDH